MSLNPRFNDKEMPLVSVLIFNYNYGRYLRECVESVLSQTYDNVEIIFSDNASEDNSWAIMNEYLQKYPDIITITRNRRNFGVEANWLNCAANARGKYYVSLCSDDALMPDFVGRCVNALETHHEAAFAMVHRMIIDENSNRVEEPPFYNRSCLISGPEQAAVYMMAAVNPSVSQIMYNKLKTTGKSPHGTHLGARWYASRIMDFNICCEYPIAYIKDPLLLHRLHFENDSFKAADDLMEVIGPYVLHHQFAYIASHSPDLIKVVERLQPAIIKLSNLCLRYSSRSLCNGDERSALRYFHLAAAMCPDIKNESVFSQLQEYWLTDDNNKLCIKEKLRAADNLITRSVSYEPPADSLDF
ncbi:MAG: glycosyltransferase family 2 protein [Smithella sp.]